MLEKFQIGSIGGYTLLHGSSKVQILNEYGCTISHLTLNGRKVLDTNTQYEDVAKQTLNKNIFLLPFPNRVAAGKYTFENTAHELEKTEAERGNAIHGLISKKKFELKDSDITQSLITVSFETMITKDEFPGYPFDLHLEIIFKLSALALDIIIKTENTGHINAPYGVGWHPYITAEKKIDDCRITIPAENELDMSVEHPLIPTGRKLHNIFGLDTRSIGDTKFDSCFTDFHRNEVQFEDITVWMDPSMKYMQLYTPPSRESLAVEPMSCAPDAFNNLMDILVLHPHQQVEHHFGLRLT